MPTSVIYREGEHGSIEGFGAQIPFEAIHEPGAYVSNWDGCLWRIPGDALRRGRSPLLSIQGNERLFVTRISQDPFVPIMKARMLAADCDATVNF